MRYVLAALIIFLLGVVGIMNPVRDVFQTVFAPIQFGIARCAFSVNDSLSFFKGVGNLREDNIALRQENNELKQRIFELKKISTDIDLFKSQDSVKLPFQIGSNRIPATFMANSTDVSGGSIILDKGTRDGVKAGNLIVIGTQLVGIVKSVEFSRSYGDLITASGVSFTVYDMDSVHKTAGLAVGMHGATISMERILPNEQISEGDTIVTSGKDGIVKPEFLVGTVTSIKNDPTQPLKTADIKTSVDLSKITRVFILLDD